MVGGARFVCLTGFACLVSVYKLTILSPYDLTEQPAIRQWRAMPLSDSVQSVLKQTSR